MSRMPMVFLVLAFLLLGAAIGWCFFGTAGAVCGAALAFLACLAMAVWVLANADIG
jgi:hypothetical protein